jgi:hypothetical protein
MTAHSNSNGSTPPPPGAKDRRVWTPKRDATLVALHGTGLTYGAIASHMGISFNAAAARIALMIRRGILPAKRGKWAGRKPE